MKKKLSILFIALFSLGQVSAQKATIHLFYPYNAQAMTAMFGVFAMAAQKNAPRNYIEVNGNYMGSIGSQEYYKIEVDPGTTILTVYTSQLAYDDAKKRQPTSTFSLKTEADKEYYIQFGSKKGCSNSKQSVYDRALSSSTILYQGTYKDSVLFNADGTINQAFQTKQIAVQQSETTPKSNEKKKNRILSDVDQNIPTAKKSAEDTYVLIIANEEYQFLDNVNFASYDGETFKEYCIKTLGIPEKQIYYCPNASYGILSGGVDWLTYALNNFEDSRAIVYYCGHGIPDEKTNEAYIIPVDGKGTNTATCYSLNKLYKTLAETKAASITYFMDACFTGANKEGSMLVAARGVAREAKKETIGGKAIVFSASSGDETAMTYAEKQHGLFTYYLLKKLQETEGDVTYEELASYISKNVKKGAFLINEKPQTPVVATSPDAAASWKSMRLK